MKIFVVTGYNGMLNVYGPVGAATTKPLAEKIAADKEYMLDKALITELELVQE